jgi:N-methylhydantoinase A/oxoprolinase/acetone carboxylase beta subunit
VALSTATYRAGVDVGGTFTDVVLSDHRGHLIVEKVLTTPADPSVGVVQAVEQALGRCDADLDDVELGIHATTLVTNAIIERRGAELGVITTGGFGDMLEIGGGTRYDVYDLFLPFPEPLVERRRRREVSERLAASGEVLRALDQDELLAQARSLVDDGVDAIAICFLHAYRNDAHEREARQALEHAFPQLKTSISSELSAEQGEFERFSTTVANAYVQPLMAGYLGLLNDWLDGDRLMLMGSNGGTVGVSTARQYPIMLIESGPAAGALAASEYSRRLGRRNVVSFDMGGTTAKICLIDDGELATVPEFEAARAERFKPGSGLPLRLPVVNLIEIGAGGGSIARVDDLGLLKVGPASAGAVPGPACYGQEGTNATVTDANLVLGYLNERSFLGGDMTLDRDAAERAIEESIATPLHMDLISAASGIHDVVNEAMAAALRMHVAERNRDPRRYSLIAFGGAGPAHAVAVARKVGIPEVVVPFGAGATSAFGLLIAAPVIDLAYTYVVDASAIDWPEVERRYGEVERRALALLADAKVRADDVAYEYSVDLRYGGQAHQLTVPFDRRVIEECDSTGLLAAFVSLYADLYSPVSPGFPVEALTWRLRAKGRAQELAVEPGAASTNGKRRPTKREVHYSGHGTVPTPVYQHGLLLPGRRIAGPAIVEQRESTAVLGIADTAVVDDALNLVISIGRRSG